MKFCEYTLIICLFTNEFKFESYKSCWLMRSWNSTYTLVYFSKLLKFMNRQTALIQKISVICIGFFIYRTLPFIDFWHLWTSFKTHKKTIWMRSPGSLTTSSKLIWVKCLNLFLCQLKLYINKSASKIKAIMDMNAIEKQLTQSP